MKKFMTLLAMMMIIMSSAAARKDNSTGVCEQYYPRVTSERMAEGESTNYVSVVVLAADDVADSIGKSVEALDKGCHLLATEGRFTIILSQIPARRLVELIKSYHLDENRVESDYKTFYPHRKLHPAEK